MKLVCDRCRKGVQTKAPLKEVARELRVKQGQGFQCPYCPEGTLKVDRIVEVKSFKPKDAPN